MEADPQKDPIAKFFSARGWEPFPYQREAWKSYAEGRSGLINGPTGYGKTLAATLGPIGEALNAKPQGLFLLYVSPLRALTRDLSQSLEKVLEEMGAGFKIECRTGDTSSSVRARQLKKLPPILFTTPESLSLMLSYPGSRDLFANLRAVVVDEWHELIASKRGVQVQLALTQLRAWSPEVRVWGLSATIGNLEEAAQSLVGPGAHLIRARLPKEIELESVIPDKIDTFPWAGHLGLSLLPQLARRLSREKSTLLFTNTRSQCERWHEALTEHLSDFAGQIAIHHSAIDRDDRENVEEGLRTGEIKWVVCTSSLDLGVDFQRVEQVVQIGSPKSLARLIQRAGRSQHRPGEPSELIFVPTNSWELVELEAVRAALAEGVVESRKPILNATDVLVQHLVTLSCGDGFRDEDLAVIRRAYSFRNLSQEEWDWCVKFIRYGGDVLQSYPEYQKIYRDEEGVYRIRNSFLARFHRMAIGTIPNSYQVSLVLGSRKRIGSIEESFISKLRRGDIFYFAGRKLEFLFLRDLKAYVKLSKKEAQSTPSWAGTQLPLSESLSYFLQARVASPPPAGIDELYQAQARISKLPALDELLFEIWDARDGRHLFVHPFGGRSVHEGLAAIWTYRLGQRQKGSFLFSVNDYSVHILGPKNYPFVDLVDASFFSTDHLEEQIEAALNLTEMSLRQFRNIAQTAGLIFSGYPGSKKSGKQLQMSTSLLFEVFRKYDSENLLFKQARRQVLQQTLDTDRLRRKLERLQKSRPVWVKIERPSPLAVPVWAEMNAARLSTESFHERMERLKAEWTATP